jgi:hypothetical protein
MQIILTFDESTKGLEVRGPVGVSPMILIALLSQSITALTATGGDNLIMPAHNLKVKSS